GQDELAERLVEAAVGDLGAAIAVGLGIDVAVEKWLCGRDAAGPEARAHFLVAVGFARDPVRQSRHTARMRRGLAPGKEADRKVETAPPEVDRARLAREAGAKAGKDRDYRCQRFAEAACGIAIIVARRLVLGERKRVGNFARSAIERRRQAMLVEDGDQAAMKRGDAAGVER